MKITCPKCGEIIEVKGLGRKSKRMFLKRYNTI